MHRQLKLIVSGIRRSNPPGDDAGLKLQEEVVRAGIKHELDEDDLIEAAAELGIDPGDLAEEMASWL